MTSRLTNPSANGTVTLVTFAALFGLVAAAMSSYRFGLSDHAEQLPIIFRYMDPTYLATDFVVNSASEFGPRFHYAHAFAFAGGLLPLPVVFAAVYVLIYVALSIVTALAAKELTGSTAAGMLATMMVISLTPFHLSNPADVTWQTVVPASMAMPFGICAIWQGVSGRPIHAALVAVPAVLVQPVLGIEMAAIALTAATVHRAATLWPLGLASTIYRVRDLGAAAAIFVTTATLFWVLPTTLTSASFRLPAEQFVQIIAHFRHPHHLVPSTWPVAEFVLAACFTVAACIALVEYGRAGRRCPALTEHRARTAAIAAAISVVLVGFVCGYVFVELVPTRLVTTAQTFRMATVITWLGWILIASRIAEVLSQRHWRWTALSMVSVASPISLMAHGVGSFVLRARGGTRAATAPASLPVLFLLTAIGLLIPLLYLERPVIVTELRPLSVGFVAAAAIVWRPRFIPAQFVLGFLVLGATLLLVVSLHGVKRFDIANVPRAVLVSGSPPVFTFAEAMGKFPGRYEDQLRLAATARTVSPDDAVFLIPREWQYWRLAAERAAVVDLKSFPFRDSGMKEWYARHQAIYDAGAGYPDDITEEELLDLRSAYGFDYAIIPKSVKTSAPLIQGSGDWKLVKLDR